MPAILAHWVVAKDVAWRFINGKKSGHELFRGESDDQHEKISRYLYFGANGPDLPYFRKRSGESEWADIFHYNKQGEFLLQLIIVARGLTDASRKKRTMAYALGHATHLAADCVVHPYVNLYAGSYKKQVKKEIHKTSECHQDSFLAKKYFGRSDIHSGSSWTHFVPSCTQIALPGIPGYTQLSGQTKDVLRDIDAAYKKTHGKSPGFDYLKNCYENYYDVVLDEGYDKARIILGLFKSPLPTTPHNSLVQHAKIKSQVTYYPDLLRKRAVAFAEKLCAECLSLFNGGAPTEARQNQFRSTVKNMNMDNGYWIDVAAEGKNLKITWKHTWCSGSSAF